MLAPWLNLQLKVQRRVAGTPNSLNEPNYGPEANYPTVYTAVWARIEYNSKAMVFTDTGERVSLGGSTIVMTEPDVRLHPEDRVTVIATDDPEQLNKVYIVMESYSEWDSMGNVHHYVSTIEIH